MYQLKKVFFKEISAKQKLVFSWDKITPKMNFTEYYMASDDYIMRFVVKRLESSILLNFQQRIYIFATGVSD